MLLSLRALGSSATFGLVCVLNRLCDFHGTARRARNRLEAPTKDERGLGRVTCAFFYIQVVSFGVGVLAPGAALLVTSGRKLA
jgi:hypothetical protein